PATARLHDIGLGDGRASFRTDHPNRAVALQVFPQRPEAYERRALFRRHENNVGLSSDSRRQVAACLPDLCSHDVIIHVNEQHTMAWFDAELLDSASVLV